MARQVAGDQFCIAGIFHGRKLSQIDGKNVISRRKLLWIARLYVLCRQSLQTIAEKTFADRHKTAKFANVFSLESFLIIFEVPVIKK